MRKTEERKKKRKRKGIEEKTKKENRRQERELRKLELKADLLKQKEAIEAAKREHELELARLGQGCNVAEHGELREDRAKAPSYPHLFMVRMTWMLTYKDLRHSQLQINERRQDEPRNLVLFCLDVP